MEEVIRLLGEILTAIRCLEGQKNRATGTEVAPPERPKPGGGGADILADLWAAKVPMLAQPRRPLAAGMRRKLEAAWRREPDAALWGERFDVVAQSDLLTGQKLDWRASLLWAVGPENSAKIDSGAYATHQAPPRSPMAIANADRALVEAIKANRERNAAALNGYDHRPEELPW